MGDKGAQALGIVDQHGRHVRKGQGHAHQGKRIKFFNKGFHDRPGGEMGDGGGQDDQAVDIFRSGKVIDHVARRFVIEGGIESAAFKADAIQVLLPDVIKHARQEHLLIGFNAPVDENAQDRSWGAGSVHRRRAAGCIRDIICLQL